MIENERSINGIQKTEVDDDYDGSGNIKLMSALAVQGAAQFSKLARTHRDRAHISSYRPHICDVLCYPFWVTEMLRAQGPSAAKAQAGSLAPILPAPFFMQTQPCTDIESVCVRERTVANGPVLAEISSSLSGSQETKVSEFGKVDGNSCATYITRNIRYEACSSRLSKILELSCPQRKQFLVCYRTYTVFRVNMYGRRTC